MEASADDTPIRVVVADDLARSRLTVGFRWLLLIPQLFWLYLWGTGVTFLLVIAWIATLITGSAPKGLADFFRMFIRYATRLAGYMLLAADPYPPFIGEAGGYPIGVEIEPKLRQNRWKTGFRMILAVPALLLAGILGTSASFSFQTAAGGAGATSAGVALTAAVLGWFVCVVRGRMPAGLRDLIAFSLGYSAQLMGYLFLVTDLYPSADPARAASGYAPPPEQAVRLLVADDLGRSRLTVFFRLALATPHLVWLALWSVAALFAVVANWFFTLFAGRPAGPLHRFVVRYVRYQTHVNAFLALIGNRFPGFAGAPDSYEIDLEVEPPARQNRWKTGFRLILALPALILAGSLSGALFLAGVFGWFAALFTGRMPPGLRNVGALSLRYSAAANAYAALLTDRYPYSGVSIGTERLPAPALADPAAPAP